MEFLIFSLIIVGICFWLLLSRIEKVIITSKQKLDCVSLADTQRQIIVININREKL